MEETSISNTNRTSIDGSSITKTADNSFGIRTRHSTQQQQQQQRREEEEEEQTAETEPADKRKADSHWKVAIA